MCDIKQIREIAVYRGVRVRVPSAPPFNTVNGTRTPFGFRGVFVFLALVAKKGSYLFRDPAADSLHTLISGVR